MATQIKEKLYLCKHKKTKESKDMALKKEIRSDNTYIISQDTTDNPKLGAKILSDGRESLFLDYYFGYTKVISERTGKEVMRKDRKREFLKLYLWQAPRTPIERQQNKEMLELAKKIRFERGQELLESVEGYRLKKDRDINFLDYFQSYIDKYTKKDYRMVVIALKRFRDFLQETPEYNKFEKKIKPEQITKDMVEAYTEYLQSRSVGEGAKSIYARFKKVVKYAVEHDVMLKNPCNGVVIKVDEQILKKEVLSPEEIQRLIATHYDNENPNIRRAFIFCLYCGLRYCDVKDLTFANVDYSNKLLKFEQNKTKGHSANSGVIIPLNDGILKLIGEPSNPNNRDEAIFPLPSYEMCLKALKRWVKRADINKHISWHCARHSFAVNILNNGANIKTVASLLGHSGLKHTEKYTRAIDSLKQDAINSLPELKL
ncbi:site-specific recombinase, phage integrase family [Prevotella bivia]|uniref:Site-specific recombinase, phage integrase family n=2 Tax=Prevotella bivia TaxID=28125 RepID=A0A137SSC1_9BACT|nr:site-specific recombinase, phage integrase family [Prevotella bivia]